MAGKKNFKTGNYMGSWGYFPQDSDYALDLQAEINDVANERLVELFNDNENNSLDGRWALVGLAVLLLKKGFHVDKNCVTLSVQYLSELQGDEAWLNGWIDKQNKDGREKILLNISLIKSELEEIINKFKDDSDTILAPRGFLLRDWELEAGASWSGLLEHI